MKRKMKFRALALSAVMTATAFAVPASAMDDAETKGLASVKQFTVDHNERMLVQANLLNDVTGEYYGMLKANGFDYKKTWDADPKKITHLITQMRSIWLEASNQYETIEGIVAGIPSTAKYDLIIDAGNPGTEKEDVAEYDMTLPDGTVLKRPGNLFHGITEPTLWGFETKNIKLTVDLNGDGKVSPGEMMPDANLVYGATQTLAHWTAEMLKDIKAWKANRDDAFTAVVTMTPTVGDYFGEWKESQFITGAIGAFAAQSRLVDVAGIMGGCRVMYFEAISPVVAAADPALDAKIKAGYEELIGLVNETYVQEKAGHQFKPEEADSLGNEAQDIADRIVAMVTQAAKKLNVNLKI